MIEPCGLYNPETAIWCECGHDFQLGQRQQLPFNIKKTVHRKSSSFVVLTVKTFLSLIVACFTIVFTFIFPGILFIFDAPYSPSVCWILFFSFTTAPLVCLSSLGFAWRLYTTERYVVACYVSLISWVNIILFFVLILTGNNSGVY
jgi:hypothetical protein